MRIDRGLSQLDIAQILDVDRSQISRYEDGSSEPTLSGFRALRRAYGVTADALLAAFDRAKRSRELKRNGRGAAA